MKDIKNIINNYKKIITILWNVQWQSIVFILLSMILTGIIPTVSTVVMRQIVNIISTPSDKIVMLISYIAIYICCDAIAGFLGVYTTYISSIFEKKLTLEIDMKILNKVKTLGLKHFEDSESYNKIQRAQAESGSQVFNYFLSITSIVKYIILIIGSGAILLSWNSWSILLVTAAAVVNTVLMLKINRTQYSILRERTGKAREKWYYQYILTNDIAFKEIKTYKLHDFFISKYKSIANEFIKQDTDIAQKITKIGKLRIVLEQLSDVIILGKIFGDTYLGKIRVGDTVAFIKSISNIKTNINGLLMQSAGIYKDTLYINQLFEFLDLKIEHKYNRNQNIGEIKDITLKNVSYKYNKTGEYALKNVSFDIKANENIMLVGKNGSGKSTLVKILAGFYDDYEGEIFINGISLHCINRDSLRKEIGLLFQDFNKYELRVRENVCVGNLEAIHNDEMIKKALNSADAPIRLLQNLDCQLGHWFEEGIQLSGGEWLKVGISRIFLRNSSLYILDEPNASLDPIGENKVMDSIKDTVKNRMSIIITHRIGNIEKIPGKIVMLDKGKVLDVGTHKEMLTRCTMYLEMFKKASN